MSGGYGVDIEGLRDHGRKIANVKEGVQLAVDAASSINPLGGAFGVLCAFMAPPVAIVQEVAEAVLRSAGGALDRSEDLLSKTWGIYESAESENAQVFAKTRRTLNDTAVYGMRGRRG